MQQPSVYRIKLPFIQCLIAIVAKDEAAYVAAFTKAHELHIEHFNTEKFKTEPAGWLPKTLMIAAVLAYDNCGFKLPFATPYVPEWLAYGNFEKCDWTQY